MFLSKSFVELIWGFSKNKGGGLIAKLLKTVGLAFHITYIQKLSLHNHQVLVVWIIQNFLSDRSVNDKLACSRPTVGGAVGERRASQQKTRGLGREEHPFQTPLAPALSP